MSQASAPAVVRRRLVPPRVRRGAAAVGSVVQRAAAATVSRPWAWVLFIGLLWAFPITRSVTRELPLPPAVLGTVPAFDLVDEQGQPASADRFRGYLWVASFSSLERMAEPAWVNARLKLQHRLRNMGDSARIVTITADPAADTVGRLNDFAQAHHAKPLQWRFLTGATADLHDALSAQLREHAPGLLADATLDASGYFLLVDPDLRVRGFYPPDAAGIERLVVDCGLVANLYRPATDSEGTAS